MLPALPCGQGLRRCGGPARGRPVQRALRTVATTRRTAVWLAGDGESRHLEPTLGVTHVDVTVRNPAQRRRAWTGSFLVDTGVVDSLVPRRYLEGLGLQPTGRRLYVTADGREVAMDVTVAELELMGELSGGVIVFGDDGSEPLLGVAALESAGIEVDPRSQRLRRLPTVRLRGFAA